MSSSDEDPPFRRTLLIGSETLLDAWSEHAAGASDVIAVPHTDLEQAIGVLDQMRPELVVVEQSLAGTERGQMLMERLHSERSLRNLEISLLAADGVDRLLSTDPGDTHPQQWLTALAQPLPPRPVRSATRARTAIEEHVTVDGHRATLIDVSATGAQVQSSVALRPNQHVRVVLAARNSTKAPGIVVWSTLLSGAPLQYRAGIAFTTPVPELAPPPDVPKTPAKASKARSKSRKSRKTK